MKSLRPIVVLAILLALVVTNVTRAQVGGAPSPPPSLWNFLGIPQGIQKLRGATSNRRGNNPQREPKPPLKAIADPKNLESKDKAIKKAAEVKQAEDLKKQKIKAVKYLTTIGCGCYDIDGGVTEALVASAGDCTEDVRYETVKAISDAAKGECCSKCGKVCCCNKEVLTKLATMAYERDDAGCYVEPSERVREAAAEALEVCCPNDTMPMIVEEEKVKEAPEPEKPDDEEKIEAPESESEAEELPGLEPDATKEDDTVARFAPLSNARPLPRNAASAYLEDQGELHSGVVVHVSNPHQLAHIRFGDAAVQPPIGSMVIVYRIDKEEPVAVARLHVVKSSPGSANVTAPKEAIERIVRGNLVVYPTPGFLSTFRQERPRQAPARRVSVTPPQRVAAVSPQRPREQVAVVSSAASKPLQLTMPKRLRPVSTAPVSAAFTQALRAKAVGPPTTLVISTDQDSSPQADDRQFRAVGRVQRTTLIQPGSILPDQYLQ